MSIVIERSGSYITVVAPFHPAWKAAARDLGGRWLAKQRAWEFDIRDEPRVREVLVDIYGTTGDDAPELVDVEYELSTSEGSRQTLYAVGRELAHRPGRDNPVRLGNKVGVLRGGFPANGGSRNGPKLEPFAGTVLIVRDVPRRLADEVVTTGQITILDATTAAGPRKAPPAVDRKVLAAERERLLRRLAEIEKLLGE